MQWEWSGGSGSSRSEKMGLNLDWWPLIVAYLLNCITTTLSAVLGTRVGRCFHDGFYKERRGF